MFTRIIPVLLFLLIPAALPARSVDAPFDERQITRITENLLHNLTTGCTEVKANALQLLIDLHVTHPEFPLEPALIPVMGIMRQHADDGLRILAAVALQKIGGDRARFAVARRALYDASGRVARQCARIARHWDGDTPFAGIFADRTAAKPGTAK